MGLMANILGTIGHNRATVGTGTRICTHADARVGAYVYVHIYAHVSRSHTCLYTLPYTPRL